MAVRFKNNKYLSMFSGIITELAKVERREANALWINANSFLAEVPNLGESVAINGVCLSVVELRGQVAKFDISQETFKRTSLGSLVFSSAVNLERSLKLGSRLDGHLVLGHVDATCSLLAVNGEQYEFSMPEKIQHLIAEKGSITLDGVSLTVGEVRSDSFFVYIIPHTKNVTLFSTYKIKTKVNVEADCIARYVERLARYQS